MSGPQAIHLVLPCIGVCLSVAVDPASISERFYEKQHQLAHGSVRDVQRHQRRSFEIDFAGVAEALRPSTGKQLMRAEDELDEDDGDEDEHDDEEAEETLAELRNRKSRRKSRHGKGGDDAGVMDTNNEFSAHDKGRGVIRRFRPLYALGIFMVALWVFIFVAAGCSVPRDQQITRIERLSVKMKPHVLDQDLYGLFAACVVRDCKDIIIGTELIYLRSARLVIAGFTWVFTMGAQIYILVAMDSLVAGIAVREIRKVYNAFELTMHGGNISNMVKVPFGGIRGKPEDYVVDNFKNLTGELQSKSCQIGLSQPNFLFVILVVWALTCAQEIKAAVRFAMRVCYCTPTVQSMADCMEPLEFETADGGRTLRPQKSVDNPTVPREYAMDADVTHEIVTGLTKRIKILFGIVMAIRVFVAGYLLWIGAYWLLATTNLQEIVFNVVALDFVLLLQHLLYVALVPLRHRREQAVILFQPLTFRRDKMEPPSCQSFFGYYLLLVASCAWVLMYMLVWQTVLPDYQWDVLEACLRHRASSWSAFHKMGA